MRNLPESWRKSWVLNRVHIYGSRRNSHTGCAITLPIHCSRPAALLQAGSEPQSSPLRSLPISYERAGVDRVGARMNLGKSFLDPFMEPAKHFLALYALAGIQ
jgi:hypothetical protein